MPASISLNALNPESLWLSVCAVVIGTSMAFGDGIQNFPIALLCLCTAVLIQAGVNLVEASAKSGEKVSPAGIIVTFILATAGAAILILKGGLPVAAVMLAAVFSAIVSAGRIPWPVPYAIKALWRFLFFGPVAVAAVYYLQSNEINGSVFLSGIAPGLVAVAATFSGPATEKVFARQMIYGLIGAALVPLLIVGMIQDHMPVMVASAALFFAGPVLSALMEHRLSGVLPNIYRFLRVYTILFFAGWNWEVLLYYARHLSKIIP
jgi:hypothetical protein